MTDWPLIGRRPAPKHRMFALDHAVWQLKSSILAPPAEFDPPGSICFAF
jgi:hypothetical protein